MACSQQTATLPALPEETLEANNAQAESTKQSTVDPVFPSHLKQVCQGEAASHSASYQASMQTTHPTYLVYRETPDDSYIDRSALGLVPAAWETEWKNLHEVELVLCTSKLQQQFVRKCEFKEAGQPTYVLEMYDTLYSAELRESKTGTMVASQELSVKANATCPKLHMFTAGKTLDKLDADYKQAIYNFAKPYVETP